MCCSLMQLHTKIYGCMYFSLLVMAADADMGVDAEGTLIVPLYVVEAN